MVVISEGGPARNEVPVSTIPIQPPLHPLVSPLTETLHDDEKQ